MYQSELEKAVIYALENSEKCREDDFILIGAVCEVMGVDIEKPFWEVLSHHLDYGIPDFEQIANVRRIVMYKRPDLLPKSVKENKVGFEE